MLTRLDSPPCAPSRPKPWEEGGKHKGPLEWQWWEAYLAQRLLG